MAPVAGAPPLDPPAPLAPALPATPVPPVPAVVELPELPATPALPPLELLEPLRFRSGEPPFELGVAPVLSLPELPLDLAPVEFCDPTGPESPFPALQPTSTLKQIGRQTQPRTLGIFRAVSEV
jgi:hypothetical protein